MKSILIYLQGEIWRARAPAGSTVHRDHTKWLAPPAACLGDDPEGKAEALQMGHQFFCRSHWSMHSIWNRCSHLNFPISSPTMYSSWKAVKTSSKQEENTSTKTEGKRLQEKVIVYMEFSGCLSISSASHGKMALILKVTTGRVSDKYTINFPTHKRFVDVIYGKICQPHRNELRLMRRFMTSFAVRNTC